MWAERYDVCNSEKGACGFALQPFEALGILGKAARLNLGYAPVSIVTVRMLVSGRIRGDTHWL